MADEADISQARMEQGEAMRERSRPADPYEPPAGVARDCIMCGEPSERLIGGACARCRDLHGLP